MGSAATRPESLEAIDRVAISGSPSHCSTGEHAALIETVPRHLPVDRFLIVEGIRREELTDSKNRALQRHLQRVSGLAGTPIPAEHVLLIGDTLDDAIAGASLGARVVLLSDGAFDRAEVVAPLGGGTVFAESLSSALRAGLDR